MNRKALVTLVTVILLVAIALPVGAQTIWQTYGNVRAKQLNVTGATDLDTTLNVDGAAQIDGALNVGGATTLAAIGAAGVTATSLQVNGSGNVTGHLDVLDYFSVSGETYFISGDAWTVTDGSVITPTGTLMELTAAGTVGAELAPCGDGQLLTLVNTAAQTITISETAGFKSAGNFAMGQYDTLTIMGVGVTCFEMARSNN